jgi:hypothetical protein
MIAVYAQKHNATEAEGFSLRIVGIFAFHQLNDRLAGIGYRAVAVRLISALFVHLARRNIWTAGYSLRRIPSLTAANEESDRSFFRAFLIAYSVSGDRVSGKIS